METPQNDPPGPPVPENDLPDLPESDLNIPDDPILDFGNSQYHSSEDLDQALQVYQAYQVPCPQDSTMTPERTINHHFTYHVAQASQTKHGSLVDKGANGRLAGSDVRILSRSSRKCTVTGIDSHELQGLDVVQCAALVETNHGTVNLIMNEYACYGKGHTIHSSGQIEWFKNSVDNRYHVAQASQAKHGSLVDKGANGGLARSDVRTLSRSSRKCTVTGIDSHELQGLDVVQCAALVETNHNIVNLIMNEYVSYGKGHTIHSSGQIEWFKNSVDNKSVQVGGKQRICTIDGCAMPLTCRGGLMYLSILHKPTDKDLERYPGVHLTRPHEWDPSVLDYTHPSGDGEPPWSNYPDERFVFNPNFDDFGDYTQRPIQTLRSFMTHHPFDPMFYPHDQPTWF